MRDVNREIRDFAKELFDANVFDGPPRAYFEVGSKRGIYKVWSLYTETQTAGEELIGLLKQHLRRLKEHGGTALFWRRDVTYGMETWHDDPSKPERRVVIALSARFTVLDTNGDEVPWPENSWQPEGLPMRALA